MKIEQWIKENISGKNSLFIERLQEKFSDKDIELFLEILNNICKYCWDSDTNCQCTNDD